MFLAFVIGSPPLLVRKEVGPSTPLGLTERGLSKMRSGARASCCPSDASGLRSEAFRLLPGRLSLSALVFARRLSLPLLLLGHALLFLFADISD